MNMNTQELQRSIIEGQFDKTLVPGNIKAGMKAVEAGSRDLWQIEPRRLKVIDGFNPRVMNDEYKAHIRAIADSIKSEGYYQDQPLAGYVATEDGQPVVYIYSGHTRLLATLLAMDEGAEITRLPVVVSQAGLSMEDMTVALVRGNGGKSLTYYESAIVCKRLVKYGMSEDEIAARTGITVPLVRNRLALMAAPLKLRTMVANDEMSATLAIELVTKHGDKALEMADEAKGRAEVSGKTKVRKAQTVASPRLKFVKKSAPKLYEAAASVKRDPGYASLSAEVRELLEGLLAEIDGKEDAPAADPRQTSIDLEAAQVAA
jgi:ParB family chromosome partitioning protein